jgi:hypothetical protein
VSTALNFAAPSAAAADRPAGYAAPRGTAVLRAQLRAVGLGVRRELAAAALLLAVVSVPMIAFHLRTPGHATDMQFAEMMVFVVLFAAFAPMAVWKGEAPSRRGYLWALPVERSRHTLLKVFAGWAWLMAAVGAFLLWAVGLARATGGTLSLGNTQIPLRSLPEGVVPTPADFVTQAWPVPGWLWLVPFAAATALYLLGSIVVLASDHPWRWIAGIALGFPLLLALGVLESGLWVRGLVEGRYGLEVLVTGCLLREVNLPTPADGFIRTDVFDPMPDAWPVAALLWTGIGLAGTLAAALARQER